MPRWIPEAAVRAIHAELLREHGGLSGDANDGALGASLARPQQLIHYEPETTLAQIAAAYGFAFTKNHCFKDGNKRIALASVDVFLRLNGHELIASEESAVFTFQDLAAGSIGEKELAEWIGSNMRKITDNA